MSSHISYVIDFDSTFVAVEALDCLASICLEHNPRRTEIVSEIETITRMGMDGSISFFESLSSRLKLFSPTKTHITQLIQLLHDSVTPSAARNKTWFIDRSEDIYIISGGFCEYIVPVVSPFGIKDSHVLANKFIYDSSDTVIGFDESVILSQPEGKVKQVAMMGLENVVVIGDGYTDYQIREKGYATQFLAFAENVQREKVLAVADKKISSFDELVVF